MGVMLFFKTDSLGDSLWTGYAYNYFGGKFSWGYDMAITPDSGFIITGSVSDYNSTVHDAFLLKTDRNGNKEWVRFYDSLQTFYDTTYNFGSHEVAYNVIQTNDGGFVLTGFTGNYELFLLKTDSIGNMLWLQKDTGIGKVYYTSSAVEVENGNLLVMCTTYLTAISIDPLMYLIKTDANGNKIWGKTYSWDYGDFTRGNKLKVNIKGDYCLMGTGFYNGLPQKGEMLFIITDTAGNEKMKKNYNGDDFTFGSNFALTNVNGYILLGASVSLTSADIYLVKTDSLGNVIWGKTYGSDSTMESGATVVQTFDKGYLICGSKSGDIYLIKTDSSGNVLSDIYEYPYRTSEKMKIYPNPFYDFTYIAFKKGNNKYLNITDITGKMIKTIDVSSKEQLKLYKNDLGKGVYFISLNEGKVIIDTKKIIIY